MRFETVQGKGERDLFSTVSEPTHHGSECAFPLTPSLCGNPGVDPIGELGEWAMGAPVGLIVNHPLLPNVLKQFHPALVSP